MTPSDDLAERVERLRASLAAIGRALDAHKPQPVGAAVLVAPILPRVDPHETPPRSKVTEAMAWLRAALAYGPMWARQVYRSAAAVGITKRTLERAKRLLGVRSEVDRRSLPRRRWVWQLPGSGPAR